MITKLVKVDAERPDLNVLREAADILRNGGLVAFPTETVYGLAANGLDAAKKYTRLRADRAIIRLY